MDNQQNQRLDQAEIDFCFELYGNIENNHLDLLRASITNLAPDIKTRILNIPFNGSLLLNLAVRLGNLEACQVLTECGARLDSRDENGHRAFDLMMLPALHIPHEEEIRTWLLQEHRAQGVVLMDIPGPPEEVAPRGIAQKRQRSLSENGDDSNKRMR